MLLDSQMTLHHIKSWQFSNCYYFPHLRANDTTHETLKRRVLVSDINLGPFNVSPIGFLSLTFRGSSLQSRSKELVCLMWGISPLSLWGKHQSHEAPFYMYHQDRGRVFGESISLLPPSIWCGPFYSSLAAGVQLVFRFFSEGIDLCIAVYLWGPWEEEFQALPLELPPELSFWMK